MIRFAKELSTYLLPDDTRIPFAKAVIRALILHFVRFETPVRIGKQWAAH